MIAILLAWQLTAVAPPATPAPIQRLAWLAGCWERVRPDGRTVEHWLAPDGGVMLGVSRSVRGGSLRDYEFMMIRPSAAGLDYVARPSGQAEASFALKRLSDDEVVFEDLAHDFPQRILYRRIDADTVAARIEGQVDGQARAVDYPYKRCAVGD